MHLLWHMGSDMPDADVLQLACQEVGVGIYGLRHSPAALFSPIADQQHRVLMAYSALSPDQIDEATLRMRRKVDGLSLGGQNRSSSLVGGTYSDPM